MSLGQHLKKRRMDLGLLQAEAARRAGVKLASYQLWERDAVVPTAPGMGKVVRFLGLDPTPLPEDCPRRLRVLRRRAGLTQAALAARLRLDVSTVSSWETGTTVPAAAFKERLGQALGPAARLLVDCALERAPPVDRAN